MLSRPLLPWAVALLGFASAQVTTDCNPMEEECDPNPGFGTEEHWTFDTRPNGGLWEGTAGTVVYEPETGARFTIDKQGDSPTIRTRFYFFFGRIEFHLKAAEGQGIVSSMMLLSDNLDEIDWEFLGTNTTHGSTNYFGKGLEDYTNGGWHEINPQEDYHNYTTIWTEEKLDWYIDGDLVRTLNANDAINENGTDVYPQTPMRMSLGIWAGGDPSLNEFTREWAGGDTDFDAGPYNMYVREARIEDYSSGAEYIWGDSSGDWESIEIVEGNSTAYDVINGNFEKEEGGWDSLPQAAKIAIPAVGAAVGAILAVAGIFYCIKQRRRGAEEARMVLQRSEADRVEMEGFKRDGVDPDAFTERAQEYNAASMKNAGAEYYNVPQASPGLENEKWGAAAFGAGAAGAGAMGAAAAARRSPNPNPFDDDAQSSRAVTPTSASFHDARGPGSPAAFHGARGPGSPASFHDNRGPGSPASFHDTRGPGSPRSQGGFGTPPPPGVHPVRTPSPGMMGSQGPMSPHSPRQGSAYSRVNSPGPQQGYGSQRMQQSPTSPQQAYGFGGYQPPYRG